MNHTIALIDLRVRRRPVIGYALGLGVYAFAIVALYPSFKNDTGLDQLAQSSSTLVAAFGINGSLTSPAGWLNANLFNNFVPLILIVLTVGYGSWCVAGQDENGTLSLTATLPTTRSRLVLDKSLALAAQAVPAVLVTYLCVLLGPGFDLHVGGWPLFGTSVALLLLAIDFGALALLVGALTGSRGVALSVSSIAAAAAYLISSLEPAINWLHPSDTHHPSTGRSATTPSRTACLSAQPSPWAPPRWHYWWQQVLPYAGLICTDEQSRARDQVFTSRGVADECPEHDPPE